MEKHINDRLSLFIIPDEKVVKIYYVYTPQEWDEKEQRFLEEFEEIITERDCEELSDEEAIKFSSRKFGDPDEPCVIQEVLIEPGQIDEVISFLLEARKHFELGHSTFIH
jgi:predicted house-cleaning noncanonical NTP pyrophosphatase (MazG superfamily)